MSRYNTLVSAEAWDGLVRDYRHLDDTEDDSEVADLLRQAIRDVEGD